MRGEVKWLRDNHFWSSTPSRFLLLAIGADLVPVFLISILGLPGVAPIESIVAFTVALVIPIVVFLINDPIKVLLVKRFWKGESNPGPTGKPHF
jgi:hypothetical protein